MSRFAVLCLSVAMLLLAAGEEYRSVSIDAKGQLYIISRAGTELRPENIQAQVAFRDPKISPDARTVGWLVMYPYESVSYPIAGKLALFRAGHVIHIFDLDQSIWAWEFQDAGKRVAYSTGPLHGGVQDCMLRDVNSGRVLAHWQAGQGKAPLWAKNLRID